MRGQVKARLSGRVAVRAVFLAALAALFVPAARATDTDCDGNDLDAAGFTCAAGQTLPDLSNAPITWSSRNCNSAFPNGDDCTSRQTFAGTFSFFGNAYTDVWLSSNGYVTFGAGSLLPVRISSIPSATDPNNAIYAYGADLYDDGSADVRFSGTEDCFSLGASSCAVVEWDNLAILDADGAEQGRATFRLALVYSTNEAWIEVVAESGADAGISPRLIGTENETGTIGLWYQNPLSDPDSRGATAGTVLRFYSAPPTVSSTVPVDNATLVSKNQSVIVTFSEPMNTGSVTISTNAIADPGGWSPTWSNSDRTVTWTHAAFAEATVYNLEVNGTDVYGSALANVDNDADPTPGSCTGYCWNFTTSDVTAPASVQSFNSVASEASVKLEWVAPAADFTGVMIVRRTGSPVAGTPVNGTNYAVGATIGTGSTVIAREPGDAGDYDSYTDTDDLEIDTLYYYKAYPYDPSNNYGIGIEVAALLQSDPPIKWTFGMPSPSLAPMGLGGDANGTTGFIVATGNDQVVHRMDWVDGDRVTGTTWPGPLIGGAVQSRPMVGDPQTGGVSQGAYGYIAAQDGLLYRVDVDDLGATVSQDVVADAGCSAGYLQAGPVVMVDAFNPGNTNTVEDVAIQATRCTGGSANANKVMMYAHDLTPAGGYVLYDGGGDGLGISNATPAILYRPGINNLIYVPLRNDPAGKSFVVLEIDDEGGAGPGVPQLANGIPYAVISGIGNIDASPVLFKKPTDDVVVVGNTSGSLYTYYAAQQIIGPPNTLVAAGAFLSTAGPGGEYPFDGPVKGLSVSTPLRDPGTGDYYQWIAWSTNNYVHAVRTSLAGADFDNASYRSRAVAGVSAPLVLRNTAGGAGPFIYVGSSDGNAYELSIDSATLVPNATFLLSPSGTVGDPTFDYGDGANQGIVFGSTDGLVHYVER